MSRDMEGQICERCKEGVYKSYWPPLQLLRCDHCGKRKQKYSDEYDGRYLTITHHHPPMESFPEEDVKELEKGVLLCANCHRELHDREKS